MNPIDRDKASLNHSHTVAKDSEPVVDSRPIGRPEITLRRFRLSGRKDPGLSKIIREDRMRRERWLIPLLTVITTILTIGALFVAGNFLIPIVIATLAYLSLRPVTSKLCRIGIPQSLASGIVITTLFSVLGVLIALLYAPAERWLSAAPESLANVRDKVQSVAEPLTAIDRADERIDDATKSLDVGSAELKVSYEKPAVVDESTLINQTGQWLAFVAAIAVLTFFMLSTGDDLLNRLLGILPNQQSRDEMLHQISDIQHSVGRYLAQITCINIGLGVVVALLMWLVGMPTPVLWGVMATLFNFVPYVGPIAGTAIIFLAAASSFETIGQAAATSFVFWLTTAVEGQFVTPSILGKTLKVGPVIVLIAVAFWGFLWGIAGVFLAVPLLIVQRKVFASFVSTYPIAVILGEDICRPGEDCEPIQEDTPIAELA